MFCQQCTARDLENSKPIGRRMTTAVSVSVSQSKFMVESRVLFDSDILSGKSSRSVNFTGQTHTHTQKKEEEKKKEKKKKKKEKRRKKTGLLCSKGDQRGHGLFCLDPTTLFSPKCEKHCRTVADVSVT